jgi:LuxR family maltose regulon positive regulatory protein
MPWTAAWSNVGPVMEGLECVMDTVTRQPCSRAGVVPRVALLDLLEASSHAELVVVVAPPGYGKTTLLAQWGDRDPRQFGWLTIEEQDNDPSVLPGRVADTIDQVEPLGGPVVLVLDDLHLLRSWDCLTMLGKLVDSLPAGSQLAVAARAEPPLALARLRAEGRLLEIGPDDLAFDLEEATALLRQAELSPGRGEVGELLRRTEGWPVALQLAASASRTRRGARADPVSLPGDDRFLIDYLQVVVLSRVPPSVVSFLTRCAVLDRMSGPLCDAVLDMTGSADLLESLSRSNMLVIPLDRRRRWYRLHRLFRELLRSQLERDEPAVARELTRRAAAWCEDNDQPEAAVDYAIAAGDAARAARLVVDVALPTYAAGRLSTLQRWFDWLESSGLAERHGPLALLGAWLSALGGRPAAAERWSETLEKWPSDDAASDRGRPADGWLALLNAALCRHGVEHMQADAETALSLAPTGTPPQAAARLLLGIADLLAGDLSSADHNLSGAAQAGEELGIDVAMVALTERSILAMGWGDWSQAELLTERARAIARPQWLERYAAGALLYAALARLAVHRGDVPQARSDLAHAEDLRPQLTYALPHLAVQVRLELARSYLALTDVAAARTALREADSVLWERPDLGVLRDQAEELRTQLGAMRTGAIGASSLTAAEVRLLRLLGTHYSFREIGGQLYLSQHTVKSQAMSIYRKFGVSSRSEAIQFARDLGLLVQ